MNQNKHSDARIYTSWLPAGELNKNIRIKNNIKTNKDYRKYLVNNADRIIEFNQRQATAEVSNSPYYRNYQVIVNSSNGNSNNSNSNNGNSNTNNNNEESDLKKLYLSRNDINKRYNTPILGQESLLAYSNPN